MKYLLWGTIVALCRGMQANGRKVVVEEIEVLDDECIHSHLI
jgi:hypothetical protein